MGRLFARRFDRDAELDKSLARLGAKSAPRWPAIGQPGEDLAERLHVTALLPEAELAAAADLLNAWIETVRARGGRGRLTTTDVAGLGVVMGEFLAVAPAPEDDEHGDAARIAAVERELGYPRGTGLDAVAQAARLAVADPASHLAVGE